MRRDLNIMFPNESYLSPATSKLKPGMATMRRNAIEYYYVQILDEPMITTETVSSVCRHLKIPSKSRRT